MNILENKEALEVFKEKEAWNDGYAYGWQESQDLIEVMSTALKYADQFISNGIELGYICMPDSDIPDSAHQTPAIVKAALRLANDNEEDKYGTAGCD
jgi:hypothetical protein